jgi:uncharacterized protein YecE (DUF72 family)
VQDESADAPKAEDASALRNLFLGCPLWGFQGWVGNFYTADARPAGFLEQYASVFNTVEGNTTFYSLPSVESVERWRLATPSWFRFCFKFPREITHRRMLDGANEVTREFLERMAPLEQRRGPFMLQLPPDFSPDRMESLDHYLGTLPGDLEIAVEVRNREFFTRQGAASALDDLLERRGCDRIVLDARALHGGDPKHPDVIAARHQKPDLPVEPRALGRHPMIRFIGHPEPAANDTWLEALGDTIGGWIGEGRTPFVMVHCPNSRHVPALARRLHELLIDRELDVGVLPPWPSERAEGDGDQLLLFPA